MRRFVSLLATATVMTLAMFLAACGGSGDPEATTTAAQEPSSVEDTDQAGSAFPVTIDHKYGSTTIGEEPRRVVSLGYQEHDTILALGVDRSRCATGTATRTT